MPWDDGLNENGRSIAGNGASPLRIAAGPGTGKTFTLIRRVSRLLEAGVRGRDIFVCSFTRTAAEDLKRELQELNEGEGVAVRTSTVHSFCFQLLARAEVLELTGRVPRPLMDFETRFLLEDLHRAGLGGIRDCKKKLDAFNAAWARLQSDEPGWPNNEADRIFHARLLEWLRFSEAMLIGELVPEALRFLRNNPASPFRPRFRHVLVDEYQDLNRAEQELLDIVASDCDLTIVGDEDQSIYSFKHAHPEGIVQFGTAHPETVDASLVECRRCPLSVITLANALIQNNVERAPRVLTPLEGAIPGEVHLVQFNSLEEEAEGVANFIDAKLRAERVTIGKVLVLASRRQVGYRIRDALLSRGRNAVSFFHEEALDGYPQEVARSKAQQTFSLLTLLANREDIVAMRCWCGYGSSSLRAGEWERLRQYCAATGTSPVDALERLAEGQININRTTGIVARYRLARAELAERINLRGTGLLNSLFPEGEPWAEPFRIIASGIEVQDYDASVLLNDVRTAIIQPELPNDVNFVRVMSLHKSKGLTADLVVVAGCIEGIIPTIDDDLAPEESERSLCEQRRVFYVAITRTTKILVLSSVATLPRDLAFQIGARVRGGTRLTANTITSRFIDELGPSRPDMLSCPRFEAVTRE